MGAIVYSFPGIPENPTADEYSAALAVPRAIGPDGLPTGDYAAALDVLSRRGEIVAACRALTVQGASVQDDPTTVLRADLVAHLQQLIGTKVAAAVAAEPTMAGKSNADIAVWLNSPRPTVIDRSQAPVIIDADELKRQIDPVEWIGLTQEKREFIQMQSGQVNLGDPKFAIVLDALFPGSDSATRQRVGVLVAAAKAPIAGPDQPPPLVAVITGIPHAPNVLTEVDIAGALGA